MCMCSIEKIDDLLEKPYYLIDFLPKRVPENANGHFFDVEYYLQSSAKHYEFKNKCVNIILKLMCYYRASVLYEKWNNSPKPKDIDAAVMEIVERNSGTLNILFTEEDVLLVLDGNCLSLTIYNLSDNMKSIVEKIVLSEGFFLWYGEDQAF